MKKFFRIRFWYIYLLGVFVFVNVLALRVRGRIDCTDDKRFSLSAASKAVLSAIEHPIRVRVLLSGKLPAEFEKLRLSLDDLLRQMNYYAHNHLLIEYDQSLLSAKDSVRNRLFDSAYRLGLRATNVEKRSADGRSAHRQSVLPGAIVSYQGRTIGVNFLSESLVNSPQSLLRAEALLEYKIVSAVDKLIHPVAPLVAYATGNGEPLGITTVDFFRLLAKNYRVDTLNLQMVSTIPDRVKTLVIVRPSVAFSHKQKIVLDQFVLRGGSVLVALDAVQADMGRLRDARQFVALPVSADLEEWLFGYGVRVNHNMILDLRADRFPVQVGWNGKNPQFELVSFPYVPLLEPNPHHPITKSLDLVVSRFPSSLDTIIQPGITKTVLLTTSELSKKQPTPSVVSWELLENLPQLGSAAFSDRSVPVAVLLEGKFPSYLSQKAIKPSLIGTSADTTHWLTTAQKRGKIIVIADADIVLNEYSTNRGPFEMGMNPFTHYMFANSVFVKNALSYLSDDHALIQARTKDFAVRLLDKKKVIKRRDAVQFVNIFLPIGGIVLFFAVYNVVRYRRYRYA